jgi:hypothetical protein
MEYYSATKKNELMLFAGKWVELEIIVLSKVNQVQKDKGCMFSLICGGYIQKINIHKYKHDHMYIFIEHFRNMECLEGLRE